MKGKKGNHLPPETERRKKSKPNQQAPPLDPVKDFETPTKKEPEQQTLVEANAEKPSTIKNGYVSVEFVKTHTDRDKNDKALVSLEISFPLLEEHRLAKVLPNRVIEVWDGLVDLGVDTISVDDIPAQVVELALAADAIEKETCIKLPFAEITNGKINVKEATGSGKAKEQTILSFRVKVEWDANVWRFAGKHFSHTVWLKMAKAQGSLLEEESERAA